MSGWILVGRSIGVRALRSGMQNASPVADVSAPDPEQTIDGLDRRDEPQPQRATEDAASRDYAYLAAVERCHYAVTSEIAKGGMGRIVEARDLRLGRRVAI